jgi:hypothetical protein
LIPEPECKVNGSNVSNVTDGHQILVNESDNVQVECIISYWGNWRSEFKCQPDASQNTSYIDSSSRDGVIEYVSIVKATHLLHQKPITCTMTFTSTSLSSQKVVAPDWNFVAWTSPKLNVSC